MDAHHPHPHDEEEDAGGHAPQLLANPLELMQYFLQARLFQRDNSENNEQLVNNLKSAKVLKSESIQNAMLKVPRGDFVPENLRDEAYFDSPLRMGKFGVNVSAPHMYATCLEALDVQPGMSFLDIGSGCGHMTVLAGVLVGDEGTALGLDIREDLIEFAQDNKRNFEKKHGMLVPNVQFELRNCFIPDLNERLWDRIHVGACTPRSKLAFLFGLLRPGGILVTPYAEKLLKITRVPESDQMKKQTLAQVNYGDLLLPSPAEIRSARIAIEKRRRSTVKVPENTFAKDFSCLVGSVQWSDVKLVAPDGSEPVPAHKALLVIASPFFEKIIKNDHDVLTIELPPEVDSTSLRYVLEYIYCGRVAVNKPHADALLQAAQSLALSELSSALQSFQPYASFSSSPSSISSSPSSSSSSLSSSPASDNLIDANASFPSSSSSSSSSSNVLTVPARNTLHERLVCLLAEPLFSDVTLVADSQNILAHKLVLAARSPYFRSILTSGMRESTQHDIAIPEVSADVLGLLLEFIYTGKLDMARVKDSGDESKTDGCELEDVLEAANYFSEARLKALCEEVFVRSMDYETVSFLFQMAQRFEATQLRTACVEFILANFDQVAQTRTFQDLDRELLVELTAESTKRLAKMEQDVIVVEQ